MKEKLSTLPKEKMSKKDVFTSQSKTTETSQSRMKS